MKLISYNRIIQNQFGYQKNSNLAIFQELQWNPNTSLNQFLVTFVELCHGLICCGWSASRYFFLKPTGQRRLSQRPTRTEIRTEINDIECFFYTKPKNSMTENNRKNQIRCKNYFLLELKPKATDFVSFSQFGFTFLEPENFLAP